MTELERLRAERDQAVDVWDKAVNEMMDARTRVANDWIARCYVADDTVHALHLENHQLREEIAALRSLIPLLRSRFESFMIWFENTVAGVH